MLRPAEMQGARPMQLHGGATGTTEDVWAMLEASARGALDRVVALAGREPALRTCQYDYTAPLHLAVREGHLEVVRFLVREGALDPGYRTHPFGESLVDIARDRGHMEIAQLLADELDSGAVTHPWGDTGAIERGRDAGQRQFQEAVDQGDESTVRAMLAVRPSLAHDPDAFWGEGILSMPAKAGNHAMLEILMQAGARVPEVSKWGARYYFRRAETAEFLLERGMKPDHMNWRRFTLLHDMAFTGDVARTRLLLEYGANADAIDDEYQSTALGYAAHWGRLEVAELLLTRGADPRRAGADWARPMAWARRRSDAAMERLLARAGG